MTNHFHKFLDGIPTTSAMLAVLNATPSEIDEAARTLSDDDFAKLGRSTLEGCRAIGVHSALWLGGTLYVYRSAAHSDARLTSFQDVCEDLEISRTMVYDRIAIFKGFADAMVIEPELMQQFPVESLSLLAAKSAPLTARTAALELARQGERVTIKRAKALLREHAVRPKSDTDDSLLPEKWDDLPQTTMMVGPTTVDSGEVLDIDADVIDQDNPAVVASMTTLSRRGETSEAPEDCQEPAYLFQGKVLQVSFTVIRRTSDLALVVRDLAEGVEKFCREHQLPSIIRRTDAA